jgi:hyperosmotically inducible protein
MKKKLNTPSVFLSCALLITGYTGIVYANTAASTDANTSASADTTPAAVSDKTISQNIKETLAKNKITKDSTVQVAVANGVVTLHGTAGNGAEADTLITTSESTPGVSEVNTDNLKTKDSSQPMTDSYITAKVKGVFIKNELMGDGVTVPAMSISVTTQNGTVLLTGNVANAAEKQKAESLAKAIKGVTDVKSSLTITPDASNDDSKDDSDQ